MLWESSNTSSEGSTSEDLSDFELDISYQDENNIGTSSHTDSDPESETQLTDGVNEGQSFRGRGRGTTRERGRGNTRGRGRGTTRGRGRGNTRGRGRGTTCGRGRSNISGRSSYDLGIPPNVNTLQTQDSCFEGMKEFLPLRDIGPQFPASFTRDTANELDTFHLFVEDTVTERLVTATEEYAERQRNRKPFMYRMFKLKPLTKEEMMRYITVLLLLSINSLRSYRQAWDRKSSQVSQEEGHSS